MDLVYRPNRIINLNISKIYSVFVSSLWELREYSLLLQLYRRGITVHIKHVM